MVSTTGFHVGGHAERLPNTSEIVVHEMERNSAFAAALPPAGLTFAAPPPL